MSEFRKQYLPNCVLAVASEGSELESLAEKIPLLGGKTAQKGKATAYVCENGACKLPTTEPAAFAREIKTVKRLGKGF